MWRGSTTYGTPRRECGVRRPQAPGEGDAVDRGGGWGDECGAEVQHTARHGVNVECAGHAGAVTAAAWPPHSRLPRGLLNLARPNAPGANVDAPDRAFHDRADALQIRHPPAGAHVCGR